MQHIIYDQWSKSTIFFYWKIKNDDIEVDLDLLLTDELK